MEVKVTIAGNEMSIPVTPEQEAELKKKYEVQFLSTFFRETSREIRQNYDFTTDETDLLVDGLFHAYPNPQELYEVIIADNYLTQIEEMALGIVEEQAKTYRVTMHYEGDFDIIVKAQSQEDARMAARDLNHCDLIDFIELADADIQYYDSYEDDDILERDIDFYAPGTE